MLRSVDVTSMTEKIKIVSFGEVSLIGSCSDRTQSIRATNLPKSGRGFLNSNRSVQPPTRGVEPLNTLLLSGRRETSEMQKQKLMDFESSARTSFVEQELTSCTGASKERV